jgi:hypothetical protein
MTTVYDTAAARPSWREENRRDREARARLDIERDAASAARDLTARQAAEKLRQERAAARRAERATAAARRAERLAALGGWVNRHVTDLLFVPVIGVPAALAWTAMASYGAHLYGTPGRALPAFSEGAMWAFAAAVTITRHRHPDRPVWHLRLGTLVFAAFGAVLNFAHGLTLCGPVTGTVMALVSVAGVTAHQLTTAGPRHVRRTRAERDGDRIARLAARRVRNAREEAVKAATVELGPDGGARLVFTTAANTDPQRPPVPPRTPKRPRTAKATGHSADTAAAIAGLRDEHPAITNADIARRLKISARTVRRYPATPKPDPASKPNGSKDG